MYSCCPPTWRQWRHMKMLLLVERRTYSPRLFIHGENENEAQHSDGTATICTQHQAHIFFALDMLRHWCLPQIRGHVPRNRSLVVMVSVFQNDGCVTMILTALTRAMKRTAVRQLNLLRLTISNIKTLRTSRKLSYISIIDTEVHSTALEQGSIQWCIHI